MSKAWEWGNDNQPLFRLAATIFFLEAAMALKDLLVCVDQTEDAIVRLHLASDMASRHGSRLTALFAREWTLAQLDRRKAAELGLVPWDKLRLLDESIAASISAVADRLQAILNELTSDRASRRTSSTSTVRLAK